MFEIGDYIVYGNNGVCEVKEITAMQMKGIDSEKLYYKLIPVENSKSTFFTPVDNKAVVMRRMLTKGDAQTLIDKVPSLLPLPIPDDKQREEIYKSAMKSCDPCEWFRIIITLYNRKQERIRQGKKTTSVDDRYYKQVESNLYGELSLALGIEKDEIIDYVKGKLDVAV